VSWTPPLSISLELSLSFKFSTLWALILELSSWVSLRPSLSLFFLTPGLLGYYTRLWLGYYFQSLEYTESPYNLNSPEPCLYPWALSVWTSPWAFFKFWILPLSLIICIPSVHALQP
jgi:hypothetical protein